MAFLTGGANTLDTGDFVTNSLRFNNSDSPRLLKSGTVAGSTTFTFSAWVKLALSDTYNFIFCDGNQVGLAKDKAVSHNSQFYLNGATGGTYTNSNGYNRDPSAWYHLVVSCNSGTGIIYVNNENRKGSINIPQLGDGLSIGSFYREDTNPDQFDYFYDGYMSEVHFVDGSALNPSSFAETDNNGVWVPKDCKDDLTYGSNGFYLQFKETGTSANSSGIGADTSGNDNHFTPTNLAATDITTDTPQNNFCTWNPLDGTDLSDLTFSEGNLKVVNATGVNRGTLAAASGKWYWEIKQITTVNAGNPIQYGIADVEDSPPTHSSLNSALIAYSDNALNCAIKKFDEGTASTITMSEFTSISQNDIINFAFDADTAKLWVGKNGTWLHSGNPAAGSNEVASTSAGNFFTPCLEHAGVTYTIEANFGNPPFSGTDKSDANGYGSFEYEPPSGFYAWCTKNLAKYG